jgi:Cu-Zn family superoxide dismutase
MRRNKSSLVILLLTVAFGFYCAPASEETSETIETAPPTPEVVATASADVFPTEGNETSGSVTFEQIDGTVKISAQLSGLAPGKHGFHIHATGDCSAPDGTSAGGHFNPGNTEHGAPDSPTHHTGDLGNIEADANGDVDFQMTVDYISLLEGPNSVSGKAVIVHAAEDDFGQPTGNAGPRLACGVIEM